MHRRPNANELGDTTRAFPSEVATMTDILADVVVPYARFLERRNRLRRIAAELKRPDEQRTIEAEVVAVAVANPLSSDQNRRSEPNPGVHSS